MKKVKRVNISVYEDEGMSFPSILMLIGQNGLDNKSESRFLLMMI